MTSELDDFTLLGIEYATSVDTLDPNLLSEIGRMGYVAHMASLLRDCKAVGRRPGIVRSFIDYMSETLHEAGYPRDISGEASLVIAFRAAYMGAEA